VDYTHVIVKGKLITTGDASLIDEINEKGFTRFEQLAAEDELK
jgi:Fe-S cluster assembly ATP-binding protein